MTKNSFQPISREKWLAFLQVKGEPYEKLLAQMDEAEQQLFAAAGPRGIYRIMNRSDVKTTGISIERHLRDCHKVAVLGFTLGIGVDNLIRRAQITDMSMAVVLDSGASLLVEQLCDAYEAEIKKEISEYTTSRFSPGYGDCPLSMQSDVIHYIDGQRKIGLSVTQNDLLVPRKSITALIGLADHPVTGSLATCGECVLREKCTLRKEGKFCGA